MGTFVALIRELRGTESQAVFAARLGIDQGEVSRLLAGTRRPARRTIVGLLRAFPERRAEVVDALLASEGG